VNSFQAKSQRLPHLDSVEMLLNDMTIQIEITSGVNDMYNFKFERAESQFLWFSHHYPTHPLPYFLMGLSNWWKIMPNTNNEKYDDIFTSYMDSTIYFAEKRYDKFPKDSKQRAEASFFLAAAWGFKGRLHSERKNWTKAAFTGRKALNYMEESKNKGELSPELLFGDGLFNYFAPWIRENYKMLRPIMLLFDKGDKKLGLQQLETVVKEAFYSRVEAQYFLMRIYAFEENQTEKALAISDYLNKTFPDNPYFQRYHARMLYTRGQLFEMKTVCMDIMSKIDSKQVGYEATSGRYAGFFLGNYHQLVDKDYDKAIEYYQKSVVYSEEVEEVEAGYYLHSLLNLAKIYKEKGDFEKAKNLIEKILDNGDSDSSAYKEAKQLKKDYKNWKKSKK
jgi:FimV-like protein